NTQLQTDLSNLQFQYLDEENNLSSLDNSEISEIQEISENVFLENEIWTEEELSKFKILYYKTKDILEKPDNDNQKLEEEINSLQNNEFKKSFDKQYCEKNCLQTQCDYSIALLRYLNFKNLSKSFQDMYLLGIIAATKRPEIFRNLKKSKLSTEYIFEEKLICLNAFKTIYGLGDTRWKNLKEYFAENDINLRKNSKTEKVGNRALSFEIVMNVITFIANYAKQNGLPSPADITYSSLHIQYLEAIKTNDQYGVSLNTFNRIWKKFLPYIKKLTPRIEEKKAKVLEWYQHIEWVHKERKNYKNYINIACNDIQKFGISNLLRPRKPNSLDITIHLSWDYAQQIQLPHSSQQEGEVYFKSLYKVHLFGICDNAFPCQVNI
ncbi:7057_t:CDS:2, partial [Scutellospora calospora]